MSLKKLSRGIYLGMIRDFSFTYLYIDLVSAVYLNPSSLSAITIDQLKHQTYNMKYI